MTVEFDPTGRDAHEPGSKMDGGKIQAGLVLGGFPRALLAVAAVGTYGARKYTPMGWRDLPNGIGRYSDAMWRHLLAEARHGSISCDPDSGSMHAAHAAWNALARLELLLIEAEEAPPK